MADVSGIICDQCGHSEWRTLYRRPMADEFERRRECLHCGARVTTSEKVKVFSEAISTGRDGPDKDSGK
jgi:transcriptional regulator NrdR family protein